MRHEKVHPFPHIISSHLQRFGTRADISPVGCGSETPAKCPEPATGIGQQHRSPWDSAGLLQVVSRGQHRPTWSSRPASLQPEPDSRAVNTGAQPCLPRWTWVCLCPRRLFPSTLGRAESPSSIWISHHTQLQWLFFYFQRENLPPSEDKIGHFQSNWMNDHQALQAVPKVEFKCVFEQCSALTGSRGLPKWPWGELPGWESGLAVGSQPSALTRESDLAGNTPTSKEFHFSPLWSQVKSPPNECAKREWDPIKKCLTVPLQGPRSVAQRLPGWWRLFMESPCPSLGPNDAHPSPHSCIFQPTVRTSGSRTPPADLVGSPVGRWEGPGSAQHPNTTSGLIRRGVQAPFLVGYTGVAMSLPIPRETRGASRPTTRGQLNTGSRWSLCFALCRGRCSLDWGQRIH